MLIKGRAHVGELIIITSYAAAPEAEEEVRETGSTIGFHNLGRFPLVRNDVFQGFGGKKKKNLHLVCRCVRATQCKVKNPDRPQMKSSLLSTGPRVNNANFWCFKLNWFSVSWKTFSIHFSLFFSSPHWKMSFPSSSSCCAPSSSAGCRKLVTAASGRLLRHSTRIMTSGSG